MKRIQYILVACVLCASVGHAQPDTLWTASYQFNNSNHDGKDVIQTSDGGFVLGGDCRDQNGMIQALLVRTDSLGRETWMRTYRMGDYHTTLGGIVETGSGEFLIACNVEFQDERYQQAALCKLNGDGDTLWSQLYGEGAFSDIIIVQDELTVVAGSTYTGIQPGLDGFAIKIDSDGGVIWSRAFGGDGNDTYSAVISTRDNGYLFVGTTRSFGHGSQGYLVKTDTDGEEQWSGSYGGEYLDGFLDAIETPDGGYLACGLSTFPRENFPVPEYRGLLVKFDANGDTLWSRIIEGDSEEIYQIINAPGSGYLSVGNGSWARRGAYGILRFNDNGDILWHLDIGGLGLSTKFRSACLLPDRGYAFCGDDLYSWGLALVRTAPDSTMLHNGVVLLDPAFPSGFSLNSPYPNPFNSSTTIRFSTGLETGPTRLAVYGVDGRLVTELENGKWKMENGNVRSATWDASGVGAGVYVVRLEGAGKAEAKKVVLVR